MPRYFGILFGEAYQSGWSEVYPIDASSYGAAASVLNNLAMARQSMMVSDARFSAGRISDSDVKGDSAPTGITFPVIGNYVTTGHTYNPEIAIRVLQLAGALKRGSRWLRALPGDIVGPSGTPVIPPPAAWSSAMNSYQMLLLTTVSLATKIRGATSPPFYTFTAITAIAETQLEARKIGRPFGLPRGRRLVA